MYTNKYSYHCIPLILLSGLLFGISPDKDLSVMKISDIASPVFRNLQLCYECEFAPITQTHMQNDGSYDQKKISSEWAPKHDMYILYYGTIPAGFCVVNHQSMIDPEKGHAHDIAEFYITPIFRHVGYGTWFAHYIFKQYPGTWEVRQLPELEKSARKFWLAAIKSIAHANFEERINPPGWNGFIQRFEIT